MAVLEICLCNF